MNISKELLSEVLSFNENWYVYSLYLEDNILNINAKSSANEKASDFIEINIYELAHKCKEWATENKYTILTENMYPNGYFAYVLSNKESIENYGYLCEHKVIEDIPHNKTEPEAVFKACQWILENK